MANNGSITTQEANVKQQGPVQPVQRRVFVPNQPLPLRPVVQQQPYSVMKQNNVMNQGQIQPGLAATSVVCDVSQEFMSDEDRRKALTTYTAFQWEKFPDKSLSDSSSSSKSCWERAIRTEERAISQRDIAKQIRHLDQNTKHYLDKKKELDTAAQRQISTAQDLLMSRDLDRGNFQWHLAQIDHQLRELAEGQLPGRRSKDISCDSGPVDRRTPRKRSKPRTGWFGSGHVDARTKSYHSIHHRAKKRYERVSLTAYFRREPAPNADVKMLYAMFKRQSQPQQLPQQANRNQDHIQNQNFEPVYPQAVHPHRQQQAPTSLAQHGGIIQPLKSKHQSGHSPAAMPIKDHNHQQKQYRGHKPRRKVARKADSDSGSSYTSSSSDTSITTPSSRGRPSKNMPSMSGVRVPSLTRTKGRTHPPLRPQLHQTVQSRVQVSNSATIEKMRDEAYDLGREHELNRISRHAIRPAVTSYQASSSGIRHVKIAPPVVTRDSLRTREYAIDDCSGNESDDYGFHDLSLDHEHRRHDNGREYSSPEGNRFSNTPSPIEAQGSVFSDDPFELRERGGSRARSKSPMVRRHIIETAEERSRHGNPFLPRYGPAAYRN